MGKIYWKNGFYDKPQEGAVEISVEYWQELLDGQSSGKEIKENESGYPVLVEHEYTIERDKDRRDQRLRQVGCCKLLDAGRKTNMAG